MGYLAPLPRLRLAGTPFAIGTRYGELARSRVRKHAANQVRQMAGRNPEQADWWRRAVWEHLPPFEEFAPHFVEEMRGLAAGADLDFEEVLLLNVRDELAPVRPSLVTRHSSPVALAPASPDRQNASACTSFGCDGSLTADGRPLLGQTKDTARVSRDLYVVIAMRQQGRPDLLQMPYAGELGVFGVSSAGMSCFGNSIYTRPAGRSSGKLPWALFRRLVLEAESVDEALALARRHGIATVGNLTIGDRTGRAIALENTGHGIGVVEAQAGILTHANHIATPELVRHEAYPEPERSGSYARAARLAERLAAERGRLTAPLALAALQDHANYPGSICRHASGPGDIETTAALVVEPAAGRLHVVRGQPCQGWPAAYSL